MTNSLVIFVIAVCSPLRIRSCSIAGAIGSVTTGVLGVGRNHTRPLARTCLVLLGFRQLSTYMISAYWQKRARDLLLSADGAFPR